LQQQAEHDHRNERLDARGFTLIELGGAMLVLGRERAAHGIDREALTER
jgi:hypothetical protein